jgi:hypothetical protein
VFRGYQDKHNFFDKFAPEPYQGGDIENNFSKLFFSKAQNFEGSGCHHCLNGGGCVLNHAEIFCFCS